MPPRHPPEPHIAVLAVTEVDAARRISVSARTIRNLRASGRLPSFTIGRCRRYLLPAVALAGRALLADRSA